MMASIDTHATRSALPAIEIVNFLRLPLNDLGSLIRPVALQFAPLRLNLSFSLVVRRLLVFTLIEDFEPQTALLDPAGTAK